MRQCECLHEPLVGVASTTNFIMIILFLPVMSMVGVFLNFINICIFGQQRNTAAKYLRALACSDVGVCMAGIFVICSDSLRAHSFAVDQIFVFLLPKIIPLGLFFQMLSVYITVLAAFDCFFSVYSGSSATRCRALLAPRGLSLVVVLVAAYNLVQFADLQAIECLHPDNFTLYELCPTELRVSEAYVVIYKGYLYGLTMAFLPFLLLSVLTIAIIYLMRRQSFQKQQQMLPSPEAPSDENGSPVVLLLVVVLFLACNVTSLLVNVFEMMKIEMSWTIEAILIDIGNLLVVFNATANFFVYYASSESFRETFRKGVQRCCCRKKRHRTKLINAAPLNSRAKCEFV